MERKPVIDIHCHTAGIGVGSSGCYVSEKLKTNWRYGIYLKAFDVTQHEVEKHGDGLVLKRLSEKIAASHSVDGAVVLALDGVIDREGALSYAQTEVYIPNDFISTQTALYDNLYFGASVNPYRPGALDLLEEVAARGAVLIKWLPPIQMIDPADTSLVPYYQKLAELDIPLLSHAGHERSFTRARPEYGDPRRLTLPLEHGVTVVAAHAATTGKTEGEDNMERLLPMLKKYPNLYTDISSLTQLNKLGYLSRLLRHEEIHDRLLYGTDMPLIATGLVSPWYFPFDLGIKHMSQICRIENPWDRDVLLKKSLGVPDHVFTRAFDLGFFTTMSAS